MKNHWHRKARRLLFDPRGRAALKEFGLDVQFAKDETELKQKPIVAIACPTYRSPEPQMNDALRAMVNYTREKDFATVYTVAPVQGSIVSWARNWLIAEQIKSGKPWTHILFIDDDIVVKEDALERLLSHKKDVVAGLCTRRNDPPVPNIRFYDKKDGNTKQIWEWPDGELIEVDSVGTGLMLISQQAVEQAAQIYFDCLWEQDFYGLSGERLERLKKVRIEAFDKDKTCYYFRLLPTPKGDIEMGEDIGFCHLLKTYANIPIHVDTSVQPGHIGKYPFSIKDFAPYRDDCILRAKLKGEYPMEVPPMKISILCPTRKRPEMVKNMLASLRETSTVMPELIYYVDDDDHETIELMMGIEAGTWNEGARYVRGPRIVMTQMWNKCLEHATGEIFLQTGDDVLFKTKGWDDQVRRAFACFPDRLILVHGDDGLWGAKFGTHCFAHRAWVDAVGYFVPPYFSSDYGDTWLNDVFNAVGRRVYLPIVTEHLHPAAGKGALDQTHKERLARHEKDDPKKLYLSLESKRQQDIQKVLSRLNIPWQPKEHADNDAHQSLIHAAG